MVRTKIFSLAGVILAAIIIAGCEGAKEPPAPQISSISPSSGPVGSSITISGANFGTQQGGATITYRGVALNATSWSNTGITAVISQGFSLGSGGIKVITIDGARSNEFQFTVTPGIVSIDPLKGAVGTEVSIQGTNFGSSQGSSTVTFNGVSCGTAISWSETLIIISVPASATTGQVIVTVDSLASNAIVFTVSPAITGLSPIKGSIGTNVTIVGTSFGASQGTSTVTFNGVDALTASSWSNTSITIPVPAGSTTGPVVVTVNGQASNGLVFSVTPAISNINLSSGPIGTSIIITGTNFGSVQGSSTVTFNGVVASVTSWSDTSITAVVPAGAAAGVNSVVVTVGGNTSNSVNFTVTPQVIGVSPSSGSGGTIITIYGTGFGAVQDTVTIGGIVASVTSWTNTQVVASVPASLTAGAQNVVVTTSAGSSGSLSFTVTPLLVSLSPSSGSTGTNVTINGSGFGAAQGGSSVSFNGVNAGAASFWSGSVITVSVPASASSGPVVVTVNGIASNSLGFSISPNISNITPSSGAVGTTVTLTGTGFGSSQGSSVVTFNGVVGLVSLWSNTSITLSVPSGASAGVNSVIVTVGGIASNSVNFTVTPQVSSLNPASGPGGTIVTIYGTSFGASQGASAVTVGGASATVASWSNSQVVVTVPASLGAGAQNVVVTVGGNPSNGVPFVVLGPTLTSLSPSSGPVGTNLIVYGANFGANQGSSIVTIGGVAVSATYWANTQIICAVPSSLTAGAQDVVVTTPAGSSGSLPFTVTPLLVSLAPSSGSGGSIVTINGSGFGTVQGGSAVSFNGLVASISGWSPSSIDAIVPNTTTTGPVVVTVSGIASNTLTFTVSPTIAGRSPISGPIGTSVVVSGTNFGPVQGSSTVTFSGVVASATSWTDTSITAVVPSDATAGVNSIVVTVLGNASNSVNFTVTPQVSSLNPASGPGGTIVTIYGTSFGAAEDTVTIGGIVASVTSWTNTQVVASVPASLGAGAQNVVVTVGGNASNNTVKFAVLGPTLTSLSPSTGPGGTTLTVYGANFGATPFTVTVGGASASVVSWSNSQVVVTVPMSLAAGSQNVVVTTPAGSSGSLPFTVTPVISGLTPSSGATGTNVTINGSGFGAVQGGSIVSFNGINAGAASYWSGSVITVSVPASASSGPVVVTVNGIASNSLGFSISPNISNISSNSGAVGTTVTLTGTGFGSSQGSSVVTFNGVVGLVSLWSNTSITLSVPSGASAGVNSVIVTVGGNASNSVNFTVTPQISSLNPASGPGGTIVTIYGTGFGAVQDTVTIGGILASVTSWTNTQVVASVPVSLAGGLQDVVVTVGGNASNSVPFTVLGPVLTYLSPGSGIVGTTLTIYGANFGATQGTSTVTIGSETPTVVSWSNTFVVVTVPLSLPDGWRDVVVTTPAGASNILPFLVTPPFAMGPVITGLSPSSAQVGTSITISGLRFGSAQSSSTVYFNGVDAGTALTWTETSIFILVPASATSGPVWVIVDGTPSNSWYFSIPPTLASVIPSIGPVGTSVTLSGSAFGSAGLVTFNGTSAPVISWSNTNILVTVPSGASSGPVIVIGDGGASNGLTFTVTPHISGINPSSGPIDTVVTIFGTSFGISQGSSNVSIGGTGAVINSWTDTQILAVVPALATGAKNVVVTVGGSSSNSVPFTVMGPEITSLSPWGDRGDSALTIYGSNFGSSQSSSTVTIGGISSAVTSWSDTQIIAIVPSSLDAGSQPVVVTTAAGSSAPMGFTVTPWIQDLSPSSGIIGSTVTITGSGFGSVQSTSTVTFSGVGAGAALFWSGNLITVTVPPSAETGAVIVTVNGVSSNWQRFDINPYIASIVPSSGSVGTTVTVTGTGFGNAGVVLFNGATAPIISWTITSVVVTVPSGATSGPVSLIVLAGGMSNAVNFSVLPAITALVPDMGEAGDTVVIFGTSFGFTQGTSTVTFNGMSAGISQWSDTLIAATVPMVPPGAAMVVVTTPSGSSAPALFTVENSSPTVLSIAPNTGINTTTTAVVISGTGFLSGLQAWLGPYALGVFSTTSTSIDGFVPSGIPWGTYDITVINPDGKTGILADGFTVTNPAPALSSISPSSGFNNQNVQVSISGSNFLPGASLSLGTVGLNGVVVNSPTSISAVVPLGITPGTYTLTIVNPDGQSAVLPDAYLAVAGPYISSLVPNAAITGTLITINGSGFGPEYCKPCGVLLVPDTATIISWSDTQITAIVPDDTLSGPAVVFVNFVPSNPMNFTVIPNITTLSPPSGPIWSPVTIEGTGFGLTQGTSTVTFGGLTATVTSWSNTTISAVVPGISGVGPVNVVVIVGGNPSAPMPFIVTPWILSLEPTSGPVGTTVTVTGTNFGAAQGSSTLTFGGVSASITSWSDNQIIATVPSTTSGPKSVVVTVNGVQSNSVIFTVSGGCGTVLGGDYLLVTSANPAPGASLTSTSTYDFTFQVSYTLSSISTATIDCMVIDQNFNILGIASVPISGGTWAVPVTVSSVTPLPTSTYIITQVAVGAIWGMVDLVSYTIDSADYFGISGSTPSEGTLLFQGDYSFSLGISYTLSSGYPIELRFLDQNLNVLGTCCTTTIGPGSGTYVASSIFSVPSTISTLFIVVEATMAFMLDIASFPVANTILVVDSNNIIDNPPGGNGDGIANPGETFDLEILLKNNGFMGAMGVQATLTSSFTGVTINTPGPVSYGDIDSGCIGSGSFNVTVASWVPGGTIITFTLQVGANGGMYTVYLTIDIPVSAVNIVIDSYSVNDNPPGGNGNGIVDPDETVDLIITLINVSAPATNVFATLSTSASGVTINTAGPVSFGNIGTGMTASGIFNVTFGSIPSGTSVIFTLTITADGGYSVVRTFTISIGMPSTIAVAIFDHAATGDISYWTGANMNDYLAYQNILTSDPSCRFTVSIVTDLLQTTLSGHDVLILPDNAVPDIYLADVDAWFTSGKTIVAVDSATCYAAYSGYMWPTCSGSNCYGSTWDYSSGFNDQRIVTTNFVTQCYTLGQVIGSISGDSQMFQASIPADAVSLTDRSADATKIYAAYRDVPGKGRIVVLGPYAAGPSVDTYPLIRDAVASQFATGSGCAGPGCGGTQYTMDPAYPYSWDASADPPSGTLAIANGIDDGTYSLSLPFSFTFYGSAYATVYIDSNGRLNFSSNVSVWVNLAFPCTAAECQLVIAPFWEDLSTNNVGSQVRWAVAGAAPNRRVVITWWNMEHLGRGDSNTFQVILYEGTNRILFQYQVINPFGAETVGLNQGDGTRYNSYPPTLLSSGLAIMFTPP